MGAPLPLAALQRQPAQLGPLDATHPMYASLVDVWVPGMSTSGLKSGIDSSTVAGGSVKSTSDGLGFNTTSVSRRYSTTILNGAQVAWLVIAHRDKSSNGEMSVVRKDGAVTPLQEWDGDVRAAFFSGSGGFSSVLNYNGGVSPLMGRVNAFCGYVASDKIAIWVNDNAESTNGGWSAGNSSNPFCIGGNENGGEIATPWTVIAVFAWQGQNIPSPAKLRAFSKNYWTIFASPRNAKNALLAGLAAAQVAAGAAIAATSSTPTLAGAALSTAINFSVASMTPTASAVAVSTAIKLSASSSTPSTSGAALATGSSWSATSSTPTTSGAALTTAIRIAATGASPSQTGAALSTGITFSAYSVTSSNSGATLSTGNSFTASSVTPSYAGAALTTAVRLASTSTSSSAAGAALATSIRLAAGSSTPTAAGATLTTGSTWSASSTTPSMAGAALQTAIRLGLANVGTPSQAGAALSTTIRLAASSATSSSAGAALTTGSSPGIDISKIDPAHIVIFEGSGSRVTPFEGSGSRVVVFEGSGARTNLNGVNVKLPTLIGTKWTVDRDPDEISHYGADITQELLDRATTAVSVVLVLVGVAQQEAPEIQIVASDAGPRTYVVAFLGGIAGDPPDGWKWVARVTCANGERFDKTTWFNEVDP